MSRTKKDLKSHKKGYGLYGFNKPKRKLTPLSLVANKITGRKGTFFYFDNNDLSQDDFGKTHSYGAKQVRGMRKRIREGRDREKTSARSRLKKDLYQIINDRN